MVWGKEGHWLVFLAAYWEGIQFSINLYTSLLVGCCFLVLGQKNRDEEREGGMFVLVVELLL